MNLRRNPYLMQLRKYVKNNRGRIFIIDHDEVHTLRHDKQIDNKLKSYNISTQWPATLIHNFIMISEQTAFIRPNSAISFEYNNVKDFDILTISAKDFLDKY